ncbi:hypothetical protein HPB47_027649 [Ixodes persulcatus]|uniref:Uncharacterized protein n=1 Tax=Ixodes persulcatus TaxID=34615 RepID=A0AC60PV98_IXOPE|nr:hypothetical protein HPB47_027649 [Ixodes persulcatus]
MARRRPQQQQPLRVWQWNCSGLGRKRGTLQLHIRNAEHMPDVLAFQESHDSVHLSGYVRFEVPVEAAVRGPRASKPVHTFVRKGIPTIQHEPVVDNVPHILLELLPRRKEQRHVFLLNVYSPPKDQSKAAAIILAEVLRVAKDTPLLVVGDFNANHAEWGHLHNLPKAVFIQECVDEHDYTILNDFRYPTRIGNSVSRNTSPDLSMTRKIGEVSWTNTGVSLGSDHYVLEMLVPVEGISAPAKRKVLVSDWDAFRRNRNASAPTTIEDLRGWIDDLLSSAKLVTVESNASSTSGVSDSKLWHMWQAHRSLQARWQAEARRNGKLRRRIARLERDIEIYADQLDRQQWGQTPTGHAVLDRLGIEPEPLQEAPVDVPKTIRKVLEVRPVPRNMHPQHHEERRKARAEALDKQHRNNSGVLHVDAAPYPGGASRNACFAIAVVNSDKSTVAQASVTTKATAVAEEAAVAVVLVHAGPLSTTITSDSKTAVRNFTRGRVCAVTERILRSFKPGSDRTRHRLVWVPAHSTHEGNKTAHATATRATSFRMPAGTLPSSLSGVDEAASHHLSMSKDCLTVFQEILQHYRLERRVYPPPDKSLTKFQALRWRELQTNTLPCPAFLRHIYPTVFDGKCARCPPPDPADGGTGPTKATIAELFWECPFDPPSSTLRGFVAHLREGEEDPLDPPWTVLLRSSDPPIQAEVVSRVDRIATEITKTLQKANERPTFD